MYNVLPHEIISIIMEYDGRYQVLKNNIISELDNNIAWYNCILNNEIESVMFYSNFLLTEDREYYNKKIKQFTFVKYCFSRTHFTF